jgi:ABC-2 type transport system permease protein
MTSVPAEPPVPFNLSGLGTLFRLTLRQHLRGWKPILLFVLFLLPSALVLVIKAAEPPGLQRNPARAMYEIEQVILFYLIPYALVTLTALLFSAGMIRDEIEEQTLTYLFVRPLPRWAIYLTKLLATWLLTVVLVTVFVLVTYVVLYWGEDRLWDGSLPVRALKLAAIQALTSGAYCAVFGLISLFTPWTFVFGVGYVILFEGILANWDIPVRYLTEMFYFRVLSVRWLSLDERMVKEAWAIDLSVVPSAAGCVLVLLGATVVLGLLGGQRLTSGEFSVKTPEGS